MTQRDIEKTNPGPTVPVGPRGKKVKEELAFDDLHQHLELRRAREFNRQERNMASTADSATLTRMSRELAPYDMLDTLLGARHCSTGSGCYLTPSQVAAIYHAFEGAGYMNQEPMDVSPITNLGKSKDVPEVIGFHTYDKGMESIASWLSSMAGAYNVVLIILATTAHGDDRLKGPWWCKGNLYAYLLYWKFRHRIVMESPLVVADPAHATKETIVDSLAPAVRSGQMSPEKPTLLINLVDGVYSGNEALAISAWWAQARAAPRGQPGNFVELMRNKIVHLHICSVAMSVPNHMGVNTRCISEQGRLLARGAPSFSSSNRQEGPDIRNYAEACAALRCSHPKPLMRCLDDLPDGPTNMDANLRSKLAYVLGAHTRIGSFNDPCPELPWTTKNASLDISSVTVIAAVCVPASKGFILPFKIPVYTSWELTDAKIDLMRHLRSANRNFSPSYRLSQICDDRMKVRLESLVDADDVDDLRLDGQRGGITLDPPRRIAQLSKLPSKGEPSTSSALAALNLPSLGQPDLKTSGWSVPSKSPHLAQRSFPLIARSPSSHSFQSNDSALDHSPAEDSDPQIARSPSSRSLHSFESAPEHLPSNAFSQRLRGLLPRGGPLTRRFWGV